MSAIRVVAAETGTVLADRLQLAFTHWTRLRGLLGTSSLASGDGLWIKPCRQVHMFGMRYAIDAVFLDDGEVVVGVVSNLAPNTLSPRIRDASSVIELPAGTVERAGLRVGARLEI